MVESRLLDLQRQQIVDLAGEGLLGTQVEVARHLHRDRRSALAAGFGRCATPRVRCPVVDAAMLVEAASSGRQHRVLHHLGISADRREIAAFFAELAEQRRRTRTPQRQLGAVVGQAADLGRFG